MDTTHQVGEIPELLADLIAADPAEAAEVADEIARRLGFELDDTAGDDA
jgi:hypothetical protein